jgi:hypothetical protein
MLKVVFGAYNQLAIYDLVEVAIVRERLNFRFGPDLFRCFNRGVHNGKLGPAECDVELAKSGHRLPATLSIAQANES